MPSIVTHYFFGQEMLKRLQNADQWDHQCREAFLFGNQGPDPLFFSFTSKHSKHIRTMGFKIHDQHCTPALKTLLRRPQDNSCSSQLRRAYQMGLLCHYTLDSNAHPYVHFFEKVLLESGIVPEGYRFPHAMLETNIDVVLMHQQGKTVSEFSVPALLHKDRRVDFAVAHLYSEFARRFYHWEIPVLEFTETFENMRFLERLLRSRRGIKRALVSQIDRLALGDSFYAAMSHANDQSVLFDYANLQHHQWTDKHGIQVNHSFFELFQYALSEAQEKICQWEQGIPVTQITGNINFEGERESTC